MFLKVYLCIWNVTTAKKGSDKEQKRYFILWFLSPKKAETTRAGSGGSQEWGTHPGLPLGCLKPNSWSIFCRFPMCIASELEWKQNSLDWIQYSQRGCLCCGQWFNLLCHNAARLKNEQREIEVGFKRDFKGHMCNKEDSHRNVPCQSIIKRKLNIDLFICSAASLDTATVRTQNLISNVSKKIQF